MTTKTTITVPVTVTVDLAVWGETYGLTVAESADDACDHLARLIGEAASETVDRIGAGASATVLDAEHDDAARLALDAATRARLVALYTAANDEADPDDTDNGAAAAAWDFADAAAVALRIRTGDEYERAPRVVWQLTADDLASVAGRPLTADELDACEAAFPNTSVDQCVWGMLNGIPGIFDEYGNPTAEPGDVPTCEDCGATSESGWGDTGRCVRCEARENVCMVHARTFVGGCPLPHESALTVGSVVRANGYEGRVTRVYDGELSGCVDVRLPGGTVVLPVGEVAAVYLAAPSRDGQVPTCPADELPNVGLKGCGAALDASSWDGEAWDCPSCGLVVFPAAVAWTARATG